MELIDNVKYVDLVKSELYSLVNEELIRNMARSKMPRKVFKVCSELHCPKQVSKYDYLM